jgi:uncharacterized protein with NAD-binding domain and iron-sulfur cluster
MMTVKKVAILGGGVSALTTALELSGEADWQERYEITVYQTGWRLGGKGASSRNEAAGGRIEEHGLHIWLGFYENAFAVIRRSYEELGRPAGTPLATWTDAFTRERNYFELGVLYLLDPLRDQAPLNPRPDEYLQLTFAEGSVAATALSYNLPSSSANTLLESAS